MAHYLKIDSDFGNDLFLYDLRFQFDPTLYYDLIEEENDIKLINIDGEGFTDVFMQDIDWIPTTSTTLMKVEIDSSIYGTSFGLFGYGLDASLHNAWGLMIDGEDIKLLIGDGTVQYHYVVFPNFKFNNNTFPINQINTIVLTQTPSNARIYVNGEFKDSVSLPIRLSSSIFPDRIYFGDIGKTLLADQFKGKIKSIGFWQRELDNFTISELSDLDFIDEHITFDDSYTRVMVNEGDIYYDGIIHKIPSMNTYITETGEESVDLIITEEIITEDDDTILLDNAVGFYNYMKPGAHRVKYKYELEINSDPEEYPNSIIITIYRFLDGELVYSLIDEQRGPIEPEKKTGDLDLDRINEYVSDLISEAVYDIAGNFSIEGLDITLEDNTNEYIVSVHPGSYYVKGKKYKIDESYDFELPKLNSFATSYGEPVIITDSPRIFSRQPIYNITRAMGPIKVVENVTRGTGGDLLSNTPVIQISKIEYAGLIVDPSKYELDGNNVVWTDVVVPQGSTYNVFYTYNALLTEGLHFYKIRGNNVSFETVNYIEDEEVIMRHKALYILKITQGSTEIDFSHVTLTDNGFIINEGTGISTGEIEVLYSYATNSLQINNWYFYITRYALQHLEIGSYIYIDYQYNLNDIYTIGITNDNEIKYYRGTPGHHNTATKPFISKDVFPLVDVYINNSIVGSSYRINKYNWVRTPVSDIRSTMGRIDILEEVILMSELEKAGSNLDSPLLLKGMFVDPLNSYSRSDIFYPNYDALIDLEQENCRSGVTKNFYSLEPNLLNINFYKDKGFMKYNKSTGYEKIVEQNNYSNFITINPTGLTNILPNVIVHNDFNYIPESTGTWANKIIDSVCHFKNKVISGSINEDFKTSFIDNLNNIFDTKEHSSRVKRLLNTIENMLNISETSNIMQQREIVLVGSGFNSSEENIQVKINNQEITNLTSLEILTDTNLNKYVNVNDPKYGVKKVYINNIEGDGWNIESDKIKANIDGNFVVKVIYNVTNMKTGIYDLALVCSQGTIKQKLNFQGITDSLKNIVNHGDRQTSNYFGLPYESLICPPSIAQSFTCNQDFVLGKLDLFFETFDASESLIVEIRESVNNFPTNNILSRKIIKEVGEGSQTRFTLPVILDDPVLMRRGNQYSICISSKSTVISSAIGKVGENKKSFSTGSATKSLITHKRLDSKLYRLKNTSIERPSFDIFNESELLFNLYAVNIDNLTQIGDFYVNTLNFNTITVPPNTFSFMLANDFFDSYDNDTTIKYEYGIENEYTSGINWFEFSPYTNIEFNTSVDTITIRITFMSINKNFTPFIHINPLLILMQPLNESYYVTRSFDIYNSNVSNAKIYTENYLPTNSDIEIYLSPDNNKTWRKIELASSESEIQLLDGRFSNFRYEHDFRLLNPIIEDSELLDAGSFNIGNYFYRISVLDSFNNEAHSNIFEVDVNSDFKKIKLECEVDPNLKGFKVYRGINPTNLYQIYNSRASIKLTSTLLTTITTIQTTNTAQFPNNGVVRIGNELIRYTGKTVNSLTGCTRGFKDSVDAEHIENSDIYLWDFGDPNEVGFDGQIPNINKDNIITFIDDNSRYSQTIILFFAGDNNTSISPTKLKIKIKLINDILYDYPRIKKLICNVLT